MILLIKKNLHAWLHTHTHTLHYFSLCSLSSETQKSSSLKNLSLSPTTINKYLTKYLNQIGTEIDFETHRWFFSTVASVSLIFFLSLATLSFLLSTLPKGRHQGPKKAAPSQGQALTFADPSHTYLRAAGSFIPKGLFIPWVASVCNQQLRREERKELPRMAGAED